MNRETMLGLMCGLGVIIFIGMLISDHAVTAAQQQEADKFAIVANAVQQKATAIAKTHDLPDWPLLSVVDASQKPVSTQVDPATLASATLIASNLVGRLEDRVKRIESDVGGVDSDSRKLNVGLAILSTRLDLLEQQLEEGRTSSISKWDVTEVVLLVNAAVIGVVSLFVPFAIAMTKRNRNKRRSSNQIIWPEGQKRCQEGRKGVRNAL